MLAVVAYLRHADSKGVSSPGTLRSAYRVTAECRSSATMSGVMGWREAEMMLCRRVGDALFSVTPFV